MLWDDQWLHVIRWNCCPDILTDSGLGCQNTVAAMGDSSIGAL